MEGRMSLKYSDIFRPQLGILKENRNSGLDNLFQEFEILFVTAPAIAI
jgi:hypothetical protein